MASTTLPPPTLPQQHSEPSLENKEQESTTPPSDGSDSISTNGSEPPIALPADQKLEWVSGVKLVNIIAAVTLVCLLMLLDSSIIVTAVPRITSDFHSLPDVGWYGSAYQLARYAVLTCHVDWPADMVLAQRFNHLPVNFI